MRTELSGWLILPALLCASCLTADDDDGVVSVRGTPIQFSADIAPLRVGVAAGVPAETSWEYSGAIRDTIGVFMQNESLGSEHAVNSPYKVTAGTAAGALGDFLSVGTPNYFPHSGDGLSFKAYYPYKNDAAITTIASTIQIDVSNQTQSATNKIDVLYAANDNGGAYFHNYDLLSITLTFSHIMSKLVVNVTHGTGTGNLTNSSVKLKSKVSKGDVDLSTGTVAPVWDLLETTIQARPVISGTTAPGTPRQYEAILVPHDFPPAGGETDSILITAGTGANAKVYVISLLTAFSTATISGVPTLVTGFESGKKYTLNAELTAGAGSSTDYVIGATTSPWGSISGLNAN